MAASNEVPSSSKRKKRSSGRYSDDMYQKIIVRSPMNPSSDERKSRFQRVFSEKDEIRLLKAVLDFSKTPGATPSPAKLVTSLLDHVVGSFSGEFSRNQLADKIRKLRHKYSKQVNNTTFIKNPHERDVFEMCHKIWGEEFAQQKDSDGYAKDPENSNLPVKEKGDSKSLPDISPTENGEESVVLELDLDKFPVLMEEISQFPGNATVKEGLRCLKATELKRLNEQWRLQQIAEAKLLAKKSELINEQIKLILEANLTSSA